MPQKVPNLALAFNLPPERAIEYFRSRGLRVAGDWKSVAAAVRAGSFSVAGVMKAQALGDIRAALLDAVETGQTWADFKRGLIPKLQAAGWWGRWPHDPETGEIVPGKGLNPRRLETVFRTNVQSAYMAGRYKGMVEASDSHPYWRYVAVMDGRTRPAHQRLNGRVFRWDDPVWQVIYPPNGYNCRCRVQPLSERDMRRNGLALSESAGHVDTVTVDLGRRGGRIDVRGLRDPATGQRFAPDPGFDNNPSDAWALDVELARRVATVRSPDIRAQAWQALNNSPARQAAWWNWANDVLDAGRPGNTAQTLGFVDDEIAGFMRDNGLDPVRVAVINEKRLAHADSEAHRNGGIALTRDQYAMLPSVIFRPDEVYYDDTHKNVVYVRRLADGGVIYVALDAADTVKKVGRVDALVNAYRLPPTHDGAGRLANVGRFVRMGG
ncbi:MAG: phage minor head protein [Rhodocyclaceae bacterium]|nr:phage minor head protein [Rhodocyclaceae bacterium]